MERAAPHVTGWSAQILGFGDRDMPDAAHGIPSWSASDTWNERKPDQPSLWESKIELGEDLFNEIINHPVPIDMNTLMALKRCFNFQQSVREPQVRKRNSMDCV